MNTPICIQAWPRLRVKKALMRSLIGLRRWQRLRAHALTVIKKLSTNYLINVELSKTPMTQAMEVLLFKEALNKFTMSHVAVKFEMIARRIAQVGDILLCQAMLQSKRSNLTVTLRALA